MTARPMTTSTTITSMGRPVLGGVGRTTAVGWGDGVGIIVSVAVGVAGSVGGGGGGGGVSVAVDVTASVDDAASAAVASIVAVTLGDGNGVARTLPTINFCPTTMMESLWRWFSFSNWASARPNLSAI